MRKKILNKFMTIISAIYLLFFIIVMFKNKIMTQSFNFFDADGLTIIGSVFALAELFISNRNAVSKRLNECIFYNKEVNYQIMIVIETSTLQIKEIVEELEKSISNYMHIEDLRRKPISQLKTNSWNVYYEGIGCEIDCSSFYLNSDGTTKCYGLKILGHGKYGKISSRKKDILYFATIIKILGNNFLVSQNIAQKTEIGKIEIVIKKEGSQIRSSNLFSEAISDVEDFHIKTVCGLEETEEIVINEQEIKWSSLNSRTLIDGFGNFTEVLCSIE